MDIDSFSTLLALVWRQYKAGNFDYELLPDAGWEFAILDMSLPSHPYIRHRDGFLGSC